MLTVCEANIENTSGRLREVNEPDDPGHFCIMSYMSRQNPDFEDYILNSPGPKYPHV
ncbi:MAG: hypothetical protein QF493_13900 [Rhodospirillales bacterium]|nr:hypothetical protein [Rhodospirillales bacterium]